MLICPNCNAEFESGKFCKKCGTALIDKTSGPTRCANCGAELEEGALFCSECGAKIQTQPQSCTCPQCGTEIKAGKNFCPKCGTKIETEASDFALKEALDTIKGTNGKTKDVSKGFEMLKAIATQGNAEAYVDLASCYKYGRGVQRNYDEAFKYYKKAEEAEIPSAYFRLGLCYFLGEGTDVDLSLAQTYFEKALDLANNKNAYFCLGRVHFENGNYLEAIKYFLEAQQIASSDPAVYYWLGILYYLGRGVAVDRIKAFAYFKKSVDEGDKNPLWVMENDPIWGYTDSIWWLAFCYEHGEGCLKNPVIAFDLYKKGHEKGLHPCTYRMGLCHIYGNGCQKDEKYGRQLIQNAANNGYEAAQKWLQNN
ncbi:MAG: zinc ribbon domain-containing protein [Paludibacteraceae bacterium]|nr:zinc ribbon domain-containing protein [Paludibacteraceae bacterium]